MDMIHIDKLKEDMILADDIRDVNGRLLLAKEEKIRSSHIRIFKMWGIFEVGITNGNGGDTVEEAVVDPDQFKKLSNDIKPIFKHVDLSHPAIKELFRLSVIFRHQNPTSDDWKSAFQRESDNPKDYMLRDIRKKLTGKKIKLPEIPSIVFELNEIIANPYASANHIAQVVKKSPSLTTLLLRIVNSSFYGFPSQIDSISRAVTIIGTREIADLALGICTISMFKDIPKKVIDMHQFLRHSFACGIISRLLAAHKNLPKTEQLFVAGLLHDIGKLIVFKYFPEQAKYVINRSRLNDRLFHQEEIDCLGCRHTDIGRCLLQRWKLPLELEKIVFYHHNPCTASNSIYPAIVHLADVMVNGLGVGSSGGIFVPPLDQEAWQSLGLSPSIFEMVINQATHQLVAFETFLQR